MLNHIDLSSVLKQTLACDLYSNLVTRPTGAAVRGQIEQMLSCADSRALTVIDFSHVSMIDFSCADEVVAKLLIRYSAEDAPQDAYFLFRGVAEDHTDAIEAVLERHHLVAALEQEDGVRLMGALEEDEKSAWDAACALGQASVTDIAIRMGCDAARAELALDGLCRRRVMMRLDGQYIAVGRWRD